MISVGTWSYLVVSYGVVCVHVGVGVCSVYKGIVHYGFALKGVVWFEICEGCVGRCVCVKACVKQVVCLTVFKYVVGPLVHVSWDSFMQACVWCL